MTKERTADVTKNRREGRQGRRKRQGYKKDRWGEEPRGEI